MNLDYSASGMTFCDKLRSLTCTCLGIKKTSIASEWDNTKMITKTIANNIWQRNLPKCQNMEIKHLPMYIINVFHNMLKVYSKITCLRINDVCMGKLRILSKARHNSYKWLYCTGFDPPIQCSITVSDVWSIIAGSVLCPNIIDPATTDQNSDKEQLITN